VSFVESSSVILATRNPGKIREFQSLLEPWGWELIGLAALGIGFDAEETGSSFEENARLKALAYSRVTKHPVLADDSGLEVFALQGCPGIYSARYAGAGASDSVRNRKLLRELEASGGERAARFVCALCLAREGLVLAEATGECRGEIVGEPRGTNGFGYDPIFLIPLLGRTCAELTKDEKNRWSHRAKAVAALADRLQIRK
jgi:XTP/dITP diphosphohydrolase